MRHVDVSLPESIRQKNAGRDGRQTGNKCSGVKYNKPTQYHCCPHEPITNPLVQLYADRESVRVIEDTRYGTKGGRVSGRRFRCIAVAAEDDHRAMASVNSVT